MGVRVSIAIFFVKVRTGPIECSHNVGINQDGAVKPLIGMQMLTYAVITKQL